MFITKQGYWLKKNKQKNNLDMIVSVTPKSPPPIVIVKDDKRKEKKE